MKRAEAAAMSVVAVCLMAVLVPFALAAELHAWAKRVWWQHRIRAWARAVLAEGKRP